MDASRNTGHAAASHVRYGLFKDDCGERLWLAVAGVDWTGNAHSAHVRYWLTAEAAVAYRTQHFPGNDVFVDSLGVFANCTGDCCV